MVHQHQRLLAIDAHGAVADTLEAAAVDQPARGQLVAAVRLGIADQVGIGLQQRIALRGADQRVLEEAAGVADLRGVGQLARADRHHRVADRGGIRR
ncbi:hypothetical protein D9M70_550020 [compost metagenome]